MDDYVLYVSGRDFPPDAQSSLADKRKTARLCHVEHDEEETYQLTWSLRAAPTIQYIPRRMVTYAIKSMLETAVEVILKSGVFILNYKLSAVPSKFFSFWTIYTTTIGSSNWLPFWCMRQILTTKDRSWCIWSRVKMAIRILTRVSLRRC